MPAKKAPNAMERPKEKAKPAAIKATIMVVNTKSSSVRVRATSLNTLGNTHLPIDNKMPTTSNPFKKAIEMAIPKLCSESLANKGTNISKGTTARS